MALSWRADEVFKKLSARLVREEATGKIRQYIFQADVSKKFLGALKQGALEASPEDGKELVRLWLFRQRSLENQNLPAERLWSFLEPLLDQAIEGGGERPRHRIPSKRPPTGSFRAIRKDEHQADRRPPTGSFRAIPSGDRIPPRRPPTGSFRAIRKDEHQADRRPPTGSFRTIRRDDAGAKHTAPMGSRVGRVENEEGGISVAERLQAARETLARAEKTKKQTASLPRIKSAPKKQTPAPKRVNIEIDDSSTDPIERSMSMILGMLAASPLMIWINFESFQLYLERRLPEYLEGDVLDLQPIWENLSLIPSVQADALESFFEELLRQDFPYKLRPPRALVDDTLSAESVASERERMINILRGSSLVRWVDPRKFEGFLKKKLLSYIKDNTLKLEPVRKLLLKNPKIPKESVDQYFLQLYDESWLWKIELPAHLIQIVKPTQTKSEESLEQMMWQLDSTVEDMFDVLNGDAKPSKSHQSIDETIEVIMGLLSSSPLLMWVNPDTFQKHLQRTLPNALDGDLLDLEPVWELLSKVPSMQQDAVHAFFSELKRSLPWRLKMPVGLQKKTTHGIHIETQNRPNILKRDAQPATRKRPTKPITAPQSEPQQASIGKMKLIKAGTPLPATKQATPKPTPSTKAESAKEARPKASPKKQAAPPSADWLEVLKSPRAILLVVVLVFAAGYFLYASFSGPAAPALGAAVTVDGLKTFPADKIYRQKDTMSLRLKSSWKKDFDRSKLVDKIFELRGTFRDEKVRYVRILRPDGMLYFHVDLEWSL
ncbi:MAG: hypothetical protein CL920_00725 [Deltaproteobacteria bacterium]|nr:hypothetical protein [Deltaproteobacteria bacterium]MBU47205.1 hypothetical protein [Deltaproteobacteria bacterium]|tara:strand:+ start:646 stop:2973 length:2328 start_codon:yes stop_codon:yes gene_type:complete